MECPAIHSQRKYSNGGLGKVADSLAMRLKPGNLAASIAGASKTRGQAIADRSTRQMPSGEH